MLNLTRIVKTFPSVTIPNKAGGLPVEVSLIAQLGHGAGNQLFEDIISRQKGHENFIDELDEPSAKLADINLELGDPTSLYSFAVGPKGHPFHRHAGHRVFTAVSGSGGAQLRFSSASMEQIEDDPQSFIKALHFINIPPDCLFTARFGGDVWHQFSPLSKNTLHPVFFALSCHTNELGGDLSDELKEKILANDANIPSLTELLPGNVKAILQSKDFQSEKIPITTLAIDAPAGTIHRKVCDSVRGNMGILRSMAASWNTPSGYVSESGMKRPVEELEAPPENSLLNKYLQNEHIDHDDTFCLSAQGDFKDIRASQILEALLEGFLNSAPKGVSRLMMIRNILVKPMGLRTSPLGCPVSPLLSDNAENVFADKYPVLDQSINKDDDHAQVILGVNDKHLKFRSCVSVQIIDEQNVQITMGTRVHCKNAFGKFYMAAIDYVHRKYISPTMLRRAADYALQEIS